MALSVKCDKGHTYTQPDLIEGDWPEDAPICPECYKAWQIEQANDFQEELGTFRRQLDRLEQMVGERYKGPVIPDPPVRPYRVVVQDSQDPGYVNKILVATPTTGLVRIEWVMGRFGQIIPVNWSMVQVNQFMNAYIPLRYSVANAQNLIVKEVIKHDFEWLFLVEHDVVMPPDTFMRMGNYMREKQVPVVSGLYYTRSRPATPLVFRGRGTGFYSDWKFGDLVWVDGAPTGCLLIHCGILRSMWEESEVYFIQHPDGRRDETRRVFRTPRDSWFDPETGSFNMTSGTSDLDWCTRVMKEEHFKKSGWDEYQEMEFPFLIDTNIFAKHINPDGEVFP